MNTDYWIARWENGQIGFHGNTYHSALEAFWHKYMPETQTVLVPLCGKSHDLLWLAHQGYHVIGVEVSDKACRQFFEENHLPVNIHKGYFFTVYASDTIQLWCGDIFKLKKNQLPVFDAIYDRAALVAFPISMRRKYAHHIQKLCTRSTSQFLISFEYAAPDEIGPPFSVPELEIEALYHNDNVVINIVDKEIALLPQAKLYKKGVHTMREKVYLIQTR